MSIFAQINEAKSRGQKKFGLVITDYLILKQVMDDIEVLGHDYELTVADGRISNMHNEVIEETRCYRIEVKL